MAKERKIPTTVYLDKSVKKDFYSKYPKSERAENIRRIINNDVNFEPVIVNPEQLLLKAIAKGDFGDYFTDGNTDKVKLTYEDKDSDIELTFKFDFDAKMEEKTVYELEHWHISTNLFKYHILEMNFEIGSDIDKMTNELIENIIYKANYYIQ